MKASPRPTATQLLLPTALPPRQLSISFETLATHGLSAEHRTATIQVLATLLLQAADVHLLEDDDVEQ